MEPTLGIIDFPETPLHESISYLDFFGEKETPIQTKTVNASQPLRTIPATEKPPELKEKRVTRLPQQEKTLSQLASVISKKIDKPDTEIQEWLKKIEPETAKILCSIKARTLELVWKFAALFTDIKSIDATNFEKLIKRFHEIKEGKRADLITFLRTIPEKNNRCFYMMCTRDLTEEGKDNFHKLADLFSKNILQFDTGQFLSLVPPESRFSAAMIVKKNIDYGGDEKTLKLFFRHIKPISNEKITRTIENAEKLSEMDSSIRNKIIILKKISSMSSFEAQELFVSLVKKIFVSGSGQKTYFKVIDFLEKISENERSSIVKLGHQFFDEDSPTELKLLVLKSILNIKETERKDVCRCVTQIFPNNTTLNEVITGIECFKEIKAYRRNFFVGKINEYFNSKKLSLQEKIQFVKKIEGEHIIDNVLIG